MKLVPQNVNNTIRKEIFQTLSNFIYFKRYSNLTVCLSPCVRKKIYYKFSKGKMGNSDGLSKFSLISGWGQVWRVCYCAHSQMLSHRFTQTFAILLLQLFHFKHCNLNPSSPSCHLFDSTANVA